MVIEVTGTLITENKTVGFARGSRVVKNFGRDLGDAQRRSRAFAQSTQGTSAGVDNLNRSVTNSTRSVAAFGARSLVAVTAVAALGTGVLALSRNASRASLNLGRAIAETSTLLDVSDAQVQRLAMTSAMLAAQFGGTAQSQAQGFYAVFSAGARDSAEALETLVAGNQLAIGGVADLGASLQLLTGTSNAFSAQMLSSTEISNIFFEVVRNGITTIPQLAASFANVSSIAAGFDVSLQTTGSSIAALTATGTQTAQATTQIRALITALSRLNEEQTTAIRALGVTDASPENFDQIIRELNAGLSGFNTQAERASALGDVFGSQIEALSAAISLTGGGFNTFERTLVATNNSLGATSRAVAKVADSDAQRLITATGRLESANIKLGDSVNDFLIPAYEEFAVQIDGLATNFDNLRTVLEAEVTDNPNGLFSRLLNIGANSLQFFSGDTGANDDVTLGTLTAGRAAQVRLRQDIQDLENQRFSIQSELNAERDRLASASDLNGQITASTLLLTLERERLDTLEEQTRLEIQAGQFVSGTQNERLEQQRLVNQLDEENNELLRERLELTQQAQIDRFRSTTGAIGAEDREFLERFNRQRAGDNVVLDIEDRINASRTREANFQAELNQIRISTDLEADRARAVRSAQLAQQIEGENDAQAQLEGALQTRLTEIEAQGNAQRLSQEETNAQRRVDLHRRTADALIQNAIAFAESQQDSSLFGLGGVQSGLATLNRGSLTDQLRAQEQERVVQGLQRFSGTIDTIGNSLENLATISDQSAESVSSALGSIGNIIGQFNPIAGAFIGSLGSIIRTVDAIVGSERDVRFRATAGIGQGTTTDVQTRNTGLRGLFLGRNGERDATNAERIALQNVLQPNIDLIEDIGESINRTFTSVAAFGETTADLAQNFLDQSARQIGGIDAFRLANESLGDTLIRVARAADDANRSFIDAGFTAGIDPNSVAGQLIGRIGGLPIGNTLALRSQEDREGLARDNFERILSEFRNERGQREFTDAEIANLAMDATALLAEVERARREFESETIGIQNSLDIDRINFAGQSIPDYIIRAQQLDINSAEDEARLLQGLLRASALFTQFNDLIETAPAFQETEVPTPEGFEPISQQSSRAGLQRQITLDSINFRTLNELRIAEAQATNLVTAQATREEGNAILRRIEAAIIEGNLSDFVTSASAEEQRTQRAMQGEMI